MFSLLRNCSSLTSITIPSSVTSIDGYAFSECSGLKKNYDLAEIPQAAYNMGFSYDNFSDITLYVPENAIASYKNQFTWSLFSNIKVIYLSPVENNFNATEYMPYYENGVLCIDGDVNVTIYNTDGKLIYNGNEKRIALRNHTMYVEKVNGKTYKIVN